MIKTARQKNLTERHIQELEVSIAAAQDRRIDGINGEKLELMLRGLIAMRDDLKQQIALYNRLCAGDLNAVKLTAWDDLPKAIIQYRIIRGKSQAAFARDLGVQSQQVQRWEMMDNQTVSYPVLCEMANLLEVPFIPSLEEGHNKSAERYRYFPKIKVLIGERHPVGLTGLRQSASGHSLWLLNNVIGDLPRGVDALTGVWTEPSTFGEENTPQVPGSTIGPVLGDLRGAIWVEDEAIWEGGEPTAKHIKMAPATSKVGYDA